MLYFREALYTREVKPCTMREENEIPPRALAALAAPMAAMELLAPTPTDPMQLTAVPIPLRAMLGERILIGPTPPIPILPPALTGPGNTQGTGWETVPMPATAITRSWHQPFSAQSGPGAEKLPSPVARPLGAAAQPAAASARQRQKKGFSMPKEQARRLAQRLKRWAVALAVAGFGTFSALVAFHQASATASSSSSSGAQSQVSTPASSNSSSSSSSSSTNATSNGSGASSSSSGSSSSSASSSSTGSSSSQDSNGFFNQQGGDNFGSQPTFGQGHSGSGVS